ncbi:transmembrane protein KIAA1109-like isoform X2 [Gigantopelta aegis]|uniref:transmembrane protein KIAA1109-like isoform X2 n=1 Tax=Gigantopelta aegis TaxID=1735272 RepID=UPI001B8891A0|nr:transmembrane protein KIAA1109-like isoform X2 [Gigantopelta aegis]
MSLNIKPNTSLIDQIKGELPRSTVYYLLIAILMAQAWTVYLTYYNSRILGLITTLVINKFFKYGHIKFGSFSFSVLSGKIMFRDFHFITEDYSIRVQYGWIIFRWWRPYVYKEITEDFSHSETRMSLFVDQLEFHIYNRSATYAHLEKLFGLKAKIIPENDGETVESRITVPQDGIHWRDLVPVIKVDINSGRLIFGNYLMPYTLIGNFEEAHLVYTTKPASTPFDQFMHVIKCKAENTRVMLVPSPKYTGPVDEPPRFMGEGFVVLQSNEFDIYFYMDEAGLVPHEPELMEMADGEVVVRRTYPCFGVDIKCGKNTDFNYGPWVDRQRDHLWKFFYPADYQPMIPSVEPKPGETRMYRSFELKMTIIAATTIDILFTKNTETQAIHMNASQGSYIEAIIPWMVEETGYETKVKGQLMLLDATTSMPYRSLMECETLEFDVAMKYPLVWNMHQDYVCNLTACKAMVYLLFEHKHFFTDLADDWSNKSRPDLYSFIPYTWTINIMVKQFELLTLTNEYNWIDPSSQHQENAHIAFCGEIFDLSVQIPFTDFLPVTLPVHLVIKGETVDCRLYLPEHHTSRHTLMALSENIKIVNRNGSNTHKSYAAFREKAWRKKTQTSAGWIDCWNTSSVAFSLLYTFHPSPILNFTSKSPIGLDELPTPMREESLLSPLRPPPSDTPKKKVTAANFDATTLEPDVINVELELAPSVLCLYGSLLRNFIHLKENYLGEDQSITDMNSSLDSVKDRYDEQDSYVHIENPDDSRSAFDARMYRPLSVTVSVVLHDIQGHLVKSCSSVDAACPTLHIERLCFEMDKSYEETKLQLLLSPAVLLVKDTVVRDVDQDHLKEGHLALSGLQVRGHAMFSHEGLTLDSETLEYAWLVEAVIGEVTGKLTSPQLQNIVEYLQTNIMLLEDAENTLKRSKPYTLCQHMIRQAQCRMAPTLPFPCPSTEDVKYMMVRASIDSINLFILETEAALNMQISPIRVSKCDLHSPSIRGGITAIVDNISMKQFISCSTLRVERSAPEKWLNAGGFAFGPIVVEAAIALPSPELYDIQDKFLHLHDKKTQRLWFLWPPEQTYAANHPNIVGKCGCIGGCKFFGYNKNGVTFFQSRKPRESSYAAVPQVCPDGLDPGFAQSLLQKDKLVFDVRQSFCKSASRVSEKDFSFTRGYMSGLNSPDSTGTANDTILECSVLRKDSDSIHKKRVSISNSETPSPVGKQIGSLSSFQHQSYPWRSSSSSPSSPSTVVRQMSLAGSISKVSIPSPVLGRHHRGSAFSYQSYQSLESEYYSAEEEKNSEVKSISSDSFDTISMSLPGSPESPGSPGSLESPGISINLDSTVIDQTVKFMGKVESDSDTESTASYESAASERNSDSTLDDPTDLSFIDLHSQMNKSITQSPLLLSCYSSHLAQYSCNDWVTPSSHSHMYAGKKVSQSFQSQFSLSSATHSVFSSSHSWIPHFIKSRDGFHTGVMKDKEEPRPATPTNVKNSKFFSSMNDQSFEECSDSETEIRLVNDTSKTTAVVKITGSFDVMLTPLLLEALQRFIESVTPSLACVHPSSLIDGLHAQCIEKVKCQNRLAKATTADVDTQDDVDVTDTPGSASNEKNKIEVFKTSSFQAFFSVPKINLCVMQASLVEEVISFAVLDNVNDLTAVSLFAVCVDGFECQILSNTHHCKRESSNIQQPNTTPSHVKTKPDLCQTDSLGSECRQVELTREENVATLQLNRMHCQLRRLLKNSNFSDHVMLTAIPEHRSSVSFTFDHTAYPLSTAPSPFPSSPRKRVSLQQSLDWQDDLTIGFIMFEGGLESISVTAVRRLGYANTVDIHLQRKMDNIEKVLEDMQQTTRDSIRQMTRSETSSTDDQPASSASGGHSSDNLQSWDSTQSIASKDSISVAPPPSTHPLEGDASNGSLQLKTIWLNFAAPPPISIKKKVDFTRLDWNLLSTATPAINAWMNPTDRLLIAVRQLVKVLTKRIGAVMACLMTEGLEAPRIHVACKSKFDKITTLSKTLRDEPSCQLLTVLQKYIHQCGTDGIERTVQSETTPQLITLQKGILALTRQWKNVLYMPNLSNLNFKAKKVRPCNVTFSLPESVSVENVMMDESECLTEHYDVVDEKTSLLQAEGGQITKSTSSLASHGPQPMSTTGKMEGPDQISTASSLSLGPKKLFAQVRSRGHSEDKKGHTHLLLPPKAHQSLSRNDSNYSFHSAAETLTSLDAGGHALSPPPTPSRSSGPKPSILKQKCEKTKDLYQWMSNQKKDFRLPMDEDTRCDRVHDSMMGGLGSAWSQDDSKTDVNDGFLTMATSIMQLADAQVLFKPLLQSLGLHVEGVRPSAVMRKFGGHLFLQIHLDQLKIQIAESEASCSKYKSFDARKRVKMNWNTSNPAFLCEGFAVNVSMKDVMDFGEESGEDEKAKSFPMTFAMHKLEAKPTTLQISFLINCNAITQLVDMALLRLVHQFVTMIANVKETQVDLKERRTSLDWIKTHRKQESKDSTSSTDTQQSDLSRLDLTPSAPSVSAADSLSTINTPDGDKARIKSPKGSKGTSPLSFDSRRPSKLQLPVLHKKSHLRFSKDSKKEKSSMTSFKQSEVFATPQSINLSDSVTIDIVDTSSPALAEKTIVDEIKESTPQCWRHLYHLLELYSTIPEPKTVYRKSGIPALSVIEEEDTDKEAHSKQSSLDDVKHLTQRKVDLAAAEEGTLGDKPPLAQTSFIKTKFKQSIYIGESIPVVVYGITKVEKVRMLAELSGLKLEAELKRVHASGTYKKKIKGVLHRISSDSSFSAHVGQTMIVLLEGIPPSMQTVVTVNIRKSQAIHTTVMRRGKEHNTALVSIGVISIDIPQHPVVLHTMMARSSRQITSTLQEFRRTQTRIGKTTDLNSSVSEKLDKHLPENMRPGRVKKQELKDEVTRLHIHFKIIMQGITTGAAILPSLKAQHRTGVITMTGMTGKKARFTGVLPKHTLSFKSKVVTTETSIPSSASIELPPFHISADYRLHKSADSESNTMSEGLVLKEGSYLNAVVEVGMLEHSLTTDLLNHLVFVQKVFMKEVNEIVQKVSGSDKPLQLLREDEDTATKDPLLYTFSVRFKGIQITATTPTSNAVRFETQEIELEVSNRVQMTAREHNPDIEYRDKKKVFIRAQVDLNVALGQLLKNPVYEEDDPEFQTMAFFKTKIGVRNALQDELIPKVSTNQEVLLINLTRPIVLAQPLAFDKAVLVWLNYKNAYEYWTEQRMSLNKEVQNATRQFIDKLPQLTPSVPVSLSTLFLQLTVDDMGICVPIESMQSGGTQTSRVVESEPGAALVLTIENTQISACSSGSLVSKGRFNGFCFRFADEFETSWDDWKPVEQDEPIMNICCVPAGTYEVCSRTINKQASAPTSNAKWILNVRWEMQGIEVNFDTNIGKQLSALGHTLTALAGETDENVYRVQDDETDFNDMEMDDAELDSLYQRSSKVSDILPDELFSQDYKERVRQIEFRMNEQAKVVQDLQDLGASESTIEVERKKLEELQAILFHDFRRDVLSRLKKQGERASAIRDTLGLDPKPSHTRSKSYGGHHGGHGRRREMSLYEGEIEKPRSPDYRSQKRSKSIEVPIATLPKVKFGGSKTETYTPPDSPTDVSERSGRSERPPFTRTPSDFVGFSSSESETSLDAETRDLQEFLRYPSAYVTNDSDSQTDNSIFASPVGGSSMSEPNVDFELDVKVLIDSGQCVLFPKEAKEELKKQQKRERSQSSEQVSPQSRRKLKRQEASASAMSGSRKAPTPVVINVEKTVFYLPGVDVKVHYSSKTGQDAGSGSGSVSDVQEKMTIKPTVSFQEPPVHSSLSAPIFNFFKKVESSTDLDDMLGSGTSMGRKTSMKKANLYACLSLQKLPEEMVISPCLLDFLEQALEPLPLFSQSSNKKESESADLMGSVLNIDLDGLNASHGSLGYPASVGSFPVDVVVLIKVESSVVRFNCLPISRVECLVQVPSLELVFSTKKSDVEGAIKESTPPTKTKMSHRTKERHSSGQGSGGGRVRLGSSLSESSGFVTTHSGGLSVTGYMSDFSLYVFHPYGASQRRSGQHTPTAKSSLGSIQEHGGNTFLELSRKDSLSLNVEFIRVNICRSRKMEIRMESSMSKSESNIRSNMVHFSAICDIGTASFKYDMRRLSEILALPKAWYRRNLARRLFLGDDSFALGGEDLDRVSCCSSPGASSERPIFMSQNSISSPSLNMIGETLHWVERKRHHRRVSSGDKVKLTQISSDFKHEIDQKSNKKGVQVPVETGPPPESAAHPAPSKPGLRSRAKHTGSETTRDRNTSSIQGHSATWETLVLFAVNLSRLDVDINMSNVMGNTVWNTKDIKTQGRLSIDSSGHKNLKITAGLGGSSFDSHGGVVGGAIDLHDLSAFFHVSEDPALGHDPDHHAGLTLHTFEGRIDYMGSSVLMTRLSSLDGRLQDEWHVERHVEEDAPVATKRSAYLFVNGNMTWDQLHLMISRSTTPDLIKLVSKLEEFFTQQLASSRRAFSSFGQIPGARQRIQSPVSSKMSDELISELRHHRHWQPALEHLVGCKFRMLSQILPNEGMILGGSVSLQGKNLSLASFHGINFRSKSWAIFNIKEPDIYFSTEAQKTSDGGTHIVEDLTFILGNTATNTKESGKNDMATICKVSRSHYVPQQFTSVQEWFSYAFADTEEVKLFPTTTPGCESLQEHRKSVIRKSQVYNHEIETIFALPSLYVNLKTFHYQGEHEPGPDDPKPVVQSSFVTEFHDHIFVAMDAEAVLFLHDLVSSYLKEKDRGERTSQRSVVKSPDSDKKKLTDPTAALKQDWREFQCKTWQLEPTVRLLHWASTQIDPVW